MSFKMIGGGLDGLADLCQSSRVGAVSSSEDKHTVDAAGQFRSGFLTIGRCGADCIEEDEFAHVFFCDGVDEAREDIGGLGGLRDDSDTVGKVDGADIGVRLDDEGSFGAGENGFHLWMGGFSEEEDLVSVSRESGGGLLDVFHERTGGVDDGELEFAQAVDFGVCGAVRADDDHLSGDGVETIEGPYSLAGEALYLLRVVDEGAEGADSAVLPGGLFRGLDGAFDAETESVRLGDFDGQRFVSSL